MKIKIYIEEKYEFTYNGNIEERTRDVVIYEQQFDNPAFDVYKLIALINQPNETITKDSK